jgi:hypothetical protein
MFTCAYTSSSFDPCSDIFKRINREIKTEFLKHQNNIIKQHKKQSILP